MSDGVLPGQLVVIWWKRWWRKRPGSHHLRCGRRTAGVRRRKPHQQQQPSRFVSFPFMIFSSFLWLCGTSKSNQIYIFTTLSRLIVYRQASSSSSSFFALTMDADGRRENWGFEDGHAGVSRRYGNILRRPLRSENWERNQERGTTRRIGTKYNRLFFLVCNELFLSFFLIFIFFQAPLFLLASI